MWIDSKIPSHFLDNLLGCGKVSGSKLCLSFFCLQSQKLLAPVLIASLHHSYSHAPAAILGSQGHCTPEESRFCITHLRHSNYPGPLEDQFTSGISSGDQLQSFSLLPTHTERQNLKNSNKQNKQIAAKPKEHRKMRIPCLFR